MINFLTKEFFVEKIDRKGPTQIQLILTPDYWVFHLVCSKFTLVSQDINNFVVNPFLTEKIGKNWDGVTLDHLMGLL